MTIKVITDYPVAFESPDHIIPVGTKNDNSTNAAYLKEVEKYFNNRKINVLDIGCAGGQLIVDLHNRGHKAVGIEGSDYSSKHKLHNWPKYHNSVLFTADVTKPFQIEENGERILFDLISAWEVVEHIHWNDLDNMFTNILSNLKEDGMFIVSVNTGPDVREDENKKLHFLHQSVFPQDFWMEYVLHKYRVESYPFLNKVRNIDNSFYVAIKKK
jgi:2-polyprenyl-3-methyl-5-hydroxy-6-metoxy-1,4-benzoquinol methylase